MGSRKIKYLSYGISAADLIKEADFGNADACFRLGEFYEHCEGNVSSDCIKALDWYLKAAEYGNCSGWFYAGALYMNGKGVKRNYSKAVNCFMRSFLKKEDYFRFDARQVILSDRNYSSTEILEWFKKAAENGSAESQFKAGKMYQCGSGIIEENADEALKYFLKSAKRGNDKAQEELALIYYSEKKYKKAFAWFLKSAIQGNVESQYMTALLYSTGEGTEINNNEYFKWMHKAALQEYAEAQYFTGQAYFEGKGVEQNCEEGMKWYIKAARQGHKKAVRKLERMKSVLPHIP